MHLRSIYSITTPADLCSRADAVEVPFPNVFTRPLIASDAGSNILSKNQAKKWINSFARSTKEEDLQTLVNKFMQEFTTRRDCKLHFCDTHSMGIEGNSGKVDLSFVAADITTVLWSNVITMAELKLDLIGAARNEAVGQLIHRCTSIFSCQIKRQSVTCFVMCKSTIEFLRLDFPAPNEMQAGRIKLFSTGMKSLDSEGLQMLCQFLLCSPLDFGFTELEVPGKLSFGTYDYSQFDLLHGVGTLRPTNSYVYKCLAELSTETRTEKHIVVAKFDANKVISAEADWLRQLAVLDVKSAAGHRLFPDLVESGLTNQQNNHSLPPAYLITKPFGAHLHSGLTSSQMCTVFGDVVSAMICAYSINQLLHRDISYANIVFVLGKSDNNKQSIGGILIDWGNAALATAEGSCGTRKFMSPFLPQDVQGQIINSEHKHSLKDDVISLLFVFCYTVSEKVQLPWHSHELITLKKHFLESSQARAQFQVSNNYQSAYNAVWKVWEQACSDQSDLTLAQRLLDVFRQQAK